MPQEVRDNSTNARYELAIDGITAFVTYLRSPGFVTLVHTEVPPALSGHGVGSALARFALDAARANGDKVIVKCSFIAAFVKQHPEYQDLVVPSAQ
jgi:uncharacterized protein